MKKHRNLLIFVIITLLRSMFIWMVKFYLRSSLKVIDISLEEIMWYISLWSVFAYLLGAIITQTFHKKNILMFIGTVSIFCMIAWHILWYFPINTFILLVAAIWFCYGTWLVVKSVIITQEIHNSGYKEARINAFFNIAMLVWIVLGSYLWFISYNKLGTNWFLTIISVLCLANILSVFLDYDRITHKTNIINNIKTILPGIIKITKKYLRLLITIWVLRAISTAIWQKMLEIWIDMFNKTPKSSIIVIISSIAWTVVWHILSIFFKKNKKAIIILFTTIFAFATIYFPHIIGKFEHYYILNICWFIIWALFWIAINLIEARYFFHIGEDHKKEYWSSVYWLITSIITFIIMLITDVMTKHAGIKVNFLFFGILILWMLFLIKKIDIKNK